MINFADYEFSFGTVHGVILFKRDSVGGMNVLRGEPTDVCPDLIAYFDKDEWAEFCMVFGNRYVKAYDPNSMNFDKESNETV